MREAQDSASEPIAYTRVTKGDLAKLEPGTVDHIMKPPRPHRGVCTAQHLPAARSPQWHSARPRAAGTPPPNDGARRRARTAAATPRHRPQPAARRAGRRPAEPVLSLLCPTAAGPRTPAGATRATVAARPRHQGQATQNATTGVRQPPHRAPPTHNKAGTPSTAAQGYQQNAPGAYQTIVFRQCSKYLQQNCAWMCARHQDQAA